MKQTCEHAYIQPYDLRHVNLSDITMDYTNTWTDSRRSFLGSKNDNPEMKKCRDK